MTRTEPYTISGNHLSHDQQAADALEFLRLEHPAAYVTVRREFPESLVWDALGSWLDIDAMGVDWEWSSWLVDAIEATGLVYWEDGEPWAGGQSDDEGAER